MTIYEVHENEHEDTPTNSHDFQDGLLRTFCDSIVTLPHQSHCMFSVQPGALPLHRSN